MAQQVELQVQPREVLGKANKRLRKTGVIPANIYGHNEPPTSVQFEADAFDRLLRTRQATGMIDLRTADTGFSQTALVRQVQRDPRSGKVIHVDFYRVSLHERVIAKVRLRFVGEAQRSSSKTASCCTCWTRVEVQGEAGSLPNSIEVDVSPLEHIDENAIFHVGAIVPAIRLHPDNRPHRSRSESSRDPRRKVAEEAEAAAETPAAVTTGAAGTGNSETSAAPHPRTPLAGVPTIHDWLAARTGRCEGGGR